MYSLVKIAAVAQAQMEAQQAALDDFYNRGK